MAMGDCLRCGTRITSGTDDRWTHLDSTQDGHEARPARGNASEKQQAKTEPVEAPRLDL